MNCINLERGALFLYELGPSQSTYPPKIHQRLAPQIKIDANIKQHMTY